MSEGEYFTLVFKGSLEEFRGNPLKTETAFGMPVACGIGDAFDEVGKLTERIESLRAALELIAGSPDWLQARQAIAALDNIGPDVSHTPSGSD